MIDFTTLSIAVPPVPGLTFPNLGPSAGLPRTPGMTSDFALAFAALAGSKIAPVASPEASPITIVLPRIAVDDGQIPAADGKPLPGAPVALDALPPVPTDGPHSALPETLEATAGWPAPPERIAGPVEFVVSIPTGAVVPVAATEAPLPEAIEPTVTIGVTTGWPTPPERIAGPVEFAIDIPTIAVAPVPAADAPLPEAIERPVRSAKRVKTAPVELQPVELPPVASATAALPPLPVGEVERTPVKTRTISEVVWAAPIVGAEIVVAPAVALQNAPDTGPVASPPTRIGAPRSASANAPVAISLPQAPIPAAPAPAAEASVEATPATAPVAMSPDQPVDVARSVELPPAPSRQMPAAEANMTTASRAPVAQPVVGQPPFDKIVAAAAPARPPTPTQAAQPISPIDGPTPTSRGAPSVPATNAIARAIVEALPVERGRVTVAAPTPAPSIVQATVPIIVAAPVVDPVVTPPAVGEHPVVAALPVAAARLAQTTDGIAPASRVESSVAAVATPAVPNATAAFVIPTPVAPPAPSPVARTTTAPAAAKPVAESKPAVRAATSPRATPFAPASQPAAQAFAAAMFAAERPAFRLTDDPAAELAAAFPFAGLTAATPVASFAVQPTPTAQNLMLDMTRDEWMGAMIEQIETIRDAAAFEAGDRGVRETRMKLAPDALGNVDVAIRRDADGQMSVRITADTAAARTILTEAAPRLTELAEARGLKLGQGDGAGQGGGSFAERQPQRGEAPVPARPVPANADAGDDPALTDIRIA